MLGVTSGLHPYFRYNFSINTIGPVPVLEYTVSPFYSVYSIYSAILLVIAVTILIIETSRKKTFLKMQTQLLLLALIFPTILNIFFEVGISLIPGVNMTPAFLWVTAILYTVALYQYQFLNIVPIARSYIVDKISIIMLVLDSNEKILDFNQSASSFFSFHKQNAIGRQIDEMIPDWPELISFFRSRTTKRTELSKKMKGGDHYFLVTNEIIFSANNEEEGLILLIQDITDQKKTELALFASEERYRTIFENMQDVFYRTDNEGRITMISPSGLKLSNFKSIEEMIGINITNLYEDQKNREKFLENLKLTGSVDSYPITIRWSDGTLRFLTTNSHFYYDTNGNILGVEGIIHDITELRKTEEILRTANKKLNLLSSITRHDIRNQIMVLKGYLHLLNNVLDDVSKVNTFLSKAEHALNTIEHQIEFTKEYEDLGVASPVWQDVKECIENSIALIPIVSTKFIIELVGLELFADPLLNKVFYNLIDNALRYGGDSMDTIRVSTTRSEYALCLIFEDNGIGITATDRLKIFNKGYGKNTGLGLFLSREILSITRITIEETGEHGKGARFEMTVPHGMYRDTDQSV